jgi:S-layer protein
LSGIETLDVTSTNNAASVSAASLSSDITTIALGSNVRTLTLADGDAVDSTAISFVLNGTTYTTAATDGTATGAEAAVLVRGVIDALTGFSATDDGAGVVTVTSVSGNAIEFGAFSGGMTDKTVGAYTNAGVTGLESDGSRVVEIHTANDISVGLADGSGTDDTVSLRLNTVTADKSVKQTINQITVANTETLNIEVTGRTDTVDTVVTTLTADAALTTLNITGESDLDLSGTITASKLATIDASTATGDVATDVPALTGGSTVKGGSGKDNFIFGTGLNLLDSVNGGDGTDVLSANISGLSGIYTGYAKLNVADVETLNLTATSSTDLDAANITGATQISLSGAQTGITNITNLAAGVAIGFGAYKTDGASSGRTDIALADATGTEDALSIVLNDTDGTNTNSIELRASGFESAAISFGYNSSLDTALANHSIDVDRLNVPKITVSGSTFDVTNALSLNTLDTDTTALDASGYGGILTATAGTATATEFTLKADRLT